MNLFFEEDGAFKAGTILKQDGNSYQVELSTGKRVKVKGGHVFFEFGAPAPAQFLAQANEEAAQIDPGFLWEVAPDEEFSYDDVAGDYFSNPTAANRAAALIALHTNPVYFYRKGRGRYRKAPEDILKRALEAVARRQALEERRRQMTAEMVAGKLPAEIAAKSYELLLHPDKNGIEWKAMSDAAAETRQSPLRLMLALGAVRSPWYWHVESFYIENFPRGRGFPAGLPEPAALGGDLPLADVRAFSIDDSSTTEIDDATSVEHLGDGHTRIGIHIAAPAYFIDRDSPVDKVARSRMSTVYAPGLKTTMLPENWIHAASLDAGCAVPCLSLYAVIDDETFGVLSTETRLERVAVTENLRIDKLQDLITEERLESGALDFPWADEIAYLWRFGKARRALREERRGKPEMKRRVDWYIELDGEGENARITIKGRMRGEPLDLLVEESMVFANETWGLWMEEHKVAGIYRSQRMGRVRMSTIPGPHDGLGVQRYAWSTSPLRRYVDLVNQRQMIAALEGRAPAFQGNDADLFGIVSQFETVYETYNDFQRRMERYWSLRWIEQEGLKEVEAVVVKAELVRIDGLPFMQRIPGLPELERGQKIRLAVLGVDYIELLIETKLLEVLDETDEVDESEGEPEVAEVPEAPETPDADAAAAAAPASEEGAAAAPQTPTIGA